VCSADVRALEDACGEDGKDEEHVEHHHRMRTQPRLGATRRGRVVETRARLLEPELLELAAHLLPARAFGDSAVAQRE